MANPISSSLARLFLIEGRARADHRPTYESCIKPGAPSQDFGDVTPIRCPDPKRYGEFVEIGRIKGQKSRVTMTISGRYFLDTKSKLLRLATLGCPIDLQIHYGQCQDASDFNSFDKIAILEDVEITNWQTDEQGAFDGDENNPVNESADVSAERIYEFIPLTFSNKAGDVISNELIDVVVCDAVSCGTCESESGGCNKIYALSKAAGGSPSTPADIVFSVDKGANWYAHDVDSLNAAEEPSGLACFGNYLVVVSNDSASLHYALKSDITPTNDEEWAEVATGFVAGGEPRAVWGGDDYLYIVGDGGYIYRTNDVTSGVSVLDAGAALTDDLQAVHGLDDNFVVAVGNASAVVKTENGVNWSEVTTVPTGVGVNYTSVWVKSTKEWFIGADDGYLYVTVDGGSSWITKTISSVSDTINDIKFSTNSIGYLSLTTTTTKGRVYQTVDGGYTWVALPQGSGILPAADRFTAIATCEYDPDFLIAVGLDDSGTDGILLVGEG